MSIGLLGNAAEVLPELVRRAKIGGTKPDLVTDQTSAHDLVNGYLPAGWTVDDWKSAQLDAGRHAALSRYGKALGTAFQIADDLLDDRSRRGARDAERLR